MTLVGEDTTMSLPTKYDCSLSGNDGGNPGFASADPFPEDCVPRKTRISGALGGAMRSVKKPKVASCSATTRRNGIGFGMQSNAPPTKRLL